MSDERYRVQSLGRALDIVEAIAAAGKDGARLTDLAQEAGLSKAAAYSMLQTLMARGMVADTGEGMTRRYRLGLSLVRLGDMAVSSTGVTDVAMPVLRQLTVSIGMTSRFAIWDEDAAVVVGRADAPDAVLFNAALGRREKPHCSAVGKIFLAGMARAEAVAILERVGYPVRTPKTLGTLATLEADLDATALRQYGVDDEEDHEGVVCVAAAVFDHNGSVAGAISVTGLKQLLPGSAVPGLAKSIIDHADKISALLGGPRSLQGWQKLGLERS